MPIVRWDPFRDLSTLQERVSRLFEGRLGPFRGEEALSTWAPPVDIYETEHEIVLKADLPEVKLEDVDIQVENNTLTVKGERHFEKEVKEDNYHRVERSYGSFARSFSLPSTVDADKIRAEYQDGVLRITMPKREEAKPKQIKVSVTSKKAA